MREHREYPVDKREGAIEKLEYIRERRDDIGSKREG